MNSAMDIQLNEHVEYKVCRSVLSSNQIEEQYLKENKTEKKKKKSSFKQRLLVMHNSWNYAYSTLAYGSLASLTPIYGLYTSFFPGLLYMIFGTSRHLSVGTFAIVSIMIAVTTSKLEDQLAGGIQTSNYVNETIITNFSNYSNNGSAQVLNDNLLVRVRIAISLAFWTGIVQIVLSIFQVGSVSKYLSPSLLSSFTTAAACETVTSQMPHLSGIYIKYKGHKYFKILFVYFDLFKNITKLNWITILISITAIATIIIVRVYINEKFKKQMRNIPIPTELIIVIVSTLISYFLQLKKNNDVKVVGFIPTGLPKPTLPDFSILFKVLPDAILIGIVSFALSVSIADLYGKKYKYLINSNKELFSLGITNAVSSFFQCFPASGALARTAVVDSSGGSSQMTTVFSSLVVLSVLLWISPLFEELPKAILGATITASLINMFKQFKDLVHYWKTDKIDFIIWIVTFLSIIMFGIDYGLFVGIASVLFFNTYRSQSPSLTELGQIQNTELYMDIETFNCSEIDHIKILRFNDSIYYINASFLQKSFIEFSSLKMNHATTGNCLNSCKGKTPKNEDAENEAVVELQTGNIIKFIILDCSMVNRLDEIGINVLKKIINDYEKENITFMLASCNEKIIDFMKLTNSYKEDFEKRIYVSVHDAVLKAISLQHKKETKN